MVIKKVEINHYKSIANMRFEYFKDGLNVFIGKNNSGKSNILEAINVIFNHDNIESQEISKFLSYQVDDNGTAPEMKINFHDDESKWIDVNFDVKQNFMKNLSRGNTKFNRDHLPRFIYLSNSNNIEVMVDSIMNIIPSDEVRYSKFLSNVNYFIGNIFNSTYKVYIDNRKTDNPEIRIIDEFNDEDTIYNKSSGTQFATLMSMLLSAGLNESHDKGFIVAIDEPETSLHIGSQKKLFKLLKEISKTHQVIIATHSVVFIDKANDENVYLVERDNIGRTTFNLKKHKNENWKSLREIIGMTISDSLLLGDLNIVVEGRTEQLIFPTMIEILKKEGKIKLDRSRYNFISAESSSKVEPFLSILKDKIELPMCVFLDNDKPGRDAEKRIRKKAKYDNDLIVIPVVENYESSEIEDMFEETFLFECINEYCENQVKNYKYLEIEELRKIRSNQKFNEFKDSLELELSNSYSLDESFEFNKMLFAIIIKNKLEESSQFPVMTDKFREIDKHFHKLTI
ncbi:ATP-dependent nuclease [Radiobacillus deserti]|uniref:AAA family ATPase n=1 Tax=Radiobacillus deserti TaxID=2594883 RepID=A0A516KKQ6_9BACI|nr:AAA family ATPase [Radiobacillus deserti]QDP41974.1 AAA family ATPase [Radiobacillus deserti]